MENRVEFIVLEELLARETSRVEGGQQGEDTLHTSLQVNELGP